MPPVPERKTKKITIEIYEDSEVAFYLALPRLKLLQSPTQEDIKSLLDAIHFPADWLSSKLESVFEYLAISWQYIYEARRYSNDYLKFSGVNFDVFADTTFGTSLRGLYHTLVNLKDIAANGDSIAVKAELSALSLFENGILTIGTNSHGRETIYLKADQSNKIKLEQAPDGFRRIFTKGSDTGHPIDFHWYLKRDNKIQGMASLTELEDAAVEDVYLKVNDDVINFSDEGDLLRHVVLSGASFEGDHVDVSNCREEFSFVLPKEKLTIDIESTDIPGQFNLEMPSFDLDRIEVSQPTTNFSPSEIPPSLQEQYNIPEGVKKEFYIRYRIITALFAEVTKHFPEMSQYIRSIVTGYLCVPFGVIDKEETHNESDRTQSYHEHVGKTVRNVLKSKPY